MSHLRYAEVLDFAAPVRAVIPGTQGRILEVLAETTAELNLRTIARLSDVSLAQASRVLPTLVELGIVERREAPPSSLFRFVPENLAARAITALTQLRQTALEELGRAAANLNPQPASVIVFGSFARGEADVDSDLDVVIVRSRDVDDDDDDGWRSSVGIFRQTARRLTGNPIEVIEVGEVEIRRLLRSGRSLWNDVQAEGVLVFGSDFAKLAKHSA